MKISIGQLNENDWKIPGVVENMFEMGACEVGAWLYSAMIEFLSRVFFSVAVGAFWLKKLSSSVLVLVAAGDSFAWTVEVERFSNPPNKSLLAEDVLGVVSKSLTHYQLRQDIINQ